MLLLLILYLSSSLVELTLVVEDPTEFFFLKPCLFFCDLPLCLHYFGVVVILLPYSTKLSTLNSPIRLKFFSELHEVKWTAHNYFFVPPVVACLQHFLFHDCPILCSSSFHLALLVAVVVLVGHHQFHYLSSHIMWLGHLSHHLTTHHLHLLVLFQWRTHLVLL